MDKAELRQELKAKRKKLSGDEVRWLSQKITERAQEILNMLAPTQNLSGAVGDRIVERQVFGAGLSISSLHTYLPIEKLNEVDTRPLIEVIRQKYPQIKIASWHKPEDHYEAVWLNENSNQTPIPKGYQFDLIIAPLLAFDDKGYRLGYGGGFYDKFLKTQSKAVKVGLCYESGHLDSLPHEPHDIPLDIVITEKSVYKFN